MKKLIFFLSLFYSLIFVSSCSEQSGTSSQVELRFQYTKQEIYASNQYAIWIEDEQGKLVKTLQVCSFTTQGRSRNGEPLVRGYIKRPLSLPTWVRRAHPDDLSDEQLDAITVATPVENGVQTVVWDMTDSEGRRVKAGTYQLVMEATLFQECTVTYRGRFTDSDCGEILMERTITMDNAEREGMITEVSARIK